MTYTFKNFACAERSFIALDSIGATLMARAIVAALACHEILDMDPLAPVNREIERD